MDLFRVKTNLRMKCKQCGHWNRIEVEKVMLNPDSPFKFFYLRTYRLILSYALNAKV